MSDTVAVPGSLGFRSMFRRKTVAPINPEKARAREAVLAVYRAARLPDPEVIVMSDPSRFARASESMELNPPSLVLLVTFSIILLAFTGVVAAGWVAGQFDGHTSLPVVLLLLLFLLVSSGRLLHMLFWYLITNPFGRMVSPPSILQDALVTSGALAINAPLARAPLLVWNDALDDTTPFVAGVDGSGDLARLASELRSYLPGATLAERHALVLAPSAVRDSAPVPRMPTTSFGAFLRRRSILRVRRLGPVEAQALVERNGVAHCLALLKANPFVSDETGTLWELLVFRGRLQWLQVQDPGTNAYVWLSIPNHVSTPREAVAWTYGMRPDAYAPTLEG